VPRKARRRSRLAEEAPRGWHYPSKVGARSERLKGAEKWGGALWLPWAIYYDAVDLLE
jgi:hypothetical protein